MPELAERTDSLVVGREETGHTRAFGMSEYKD